MHLFEYYKDSPRDLASASSLDTAEAPHMQITQLSNILMSLCRRSSSVNSCYLGWPSPGQEKDSWRAMSRSTAAPILRLVAMIANGLLACIFLLDRIFVYPSQDSQHLRKGIIPLPHLSLYESSAKHVFDEMDINMRSGGRPEYQVYTYKAEKSLDKELSQ